MQGVCIGRMCFIFLFHFKRTWVRTSFLRISCEPTSYVLLLYSIVTMKTSGFSLDDIPYDHCLDAIFCICVNILFLNVFVAFTQKFQFDQQLPVSFTIPNIWLKICPLNHLDKQSHRSYASRSYKLVKL